jgi:hypothetical protein
MVNVKYFLMANEKYKSMHGFLMVNVKYLMNLNERKNNKEKIIMLYGMEGLLRSSKTPRILNKVLLKLLQASS